MTKKSHAGAKLTVIAGATILDGEGGAPIRNGSVLIRGSRIEAIVDESYVPPEDAVLVDAKGKYVIPGLMDANVHLIFDLMPETLIRYEHSYDELALEAAQISLKAGITTVFDTWGPRRALTRARDRINRGEFAASRIFLAGNIVGLDGPYSTDFFPHIRDAVLEVCANRINSQWQENVGRRLTWMSPQQVRSELRAYLEHDIDFLKYAVNGHPLDAMDLIQFSPRVQRIIVEEAHESGRTVQTHTTSGEGLRLAVEAGVDLLQHASTTGPEPIPEDTLQLLAEKKTPCVILAMTELALEFYRERAKVTPWAKMYEVADVNERALLQMGADILFATDGGVLGASTQNGAHFSSKPPSENLEVLGEGHIHWFKAVEQKGMKPMDALRAATQNVAKAYGIAESLGTIAPGKIADLVILDRDPLETWRNYETVHMVIKDGLIVDRENLPAKRILTTC